jgi:hypothetical protein
MKILRSVWKIAPALLALSLLLAVSPVRAEDTPPKKEKAPSKAELKKYDANGDGQLDEAETAKMKADEKAKRDAQRAEELAKYDANRDGKLNKEEREKEKADKAAARAEKKAEKDARQAAKDEQK